MIFASELPHFHSNLPRNIGEIISFLMCAWKAETPLALISLRRRHRMLILHDFSPAYTKKCEIGRAKNKSRRHWQLEDIYSPFSSTYVIIITNIGLVMGMYCTKEEFNNKSHPPTANYLEQFLQNYILSILYARLMLNQNESRIIFSLTKKMPIEKPDTHFGTSGSREEEWCSRKYLWNHLFSSLKLEKSNHVQ